MQETGAFFALWEFLTGLGMIEDDQRDGRRHKLDTGFILTGNSQSSAIFCETSIKFLPHFCMDREKR
jgi:hypothetical protein